jgi:hypothetical protein
MWPAAAYNLLLPVLRLFALLVMRLIPRAVSDRTLRQALRLCFPTVLSGAAREVGNSRLETTRSLGRQSEIGDRA